MRWFSVAVVAALLVSFGVRSFDKCPGVCSCSRKGGWRTVECADRALITVPMGVDTETQVLDLSGNNLRVLPNMTFSRAGLMNLREVNLRNCNVDQIDGMAFHGLTNLIELDLSENALTSVPSYVFRDVPRLRDLSVAGNPIRSIGADAFADCSAILRLNVSHCKLRSVAERAFDGIVELRTLRVNGNNLTALSATVVESLKSLRSVELHDNPWVCDCRLRPMKLWLTSENLLYSQSALCSGGPDSLSGKPLTELRVDDLNCLQPVVAIDRPSVTASTVDSPHESGRSAVMVSSVVCVLGLIAVIALIVVRAVRSIYPPGAKPAETTGSGGGKTSLALDLIHDHDAFRPEFRDSPSYWVANANKPPPSKCLPTVRTERVAAGSAEVLSYASQSQYPADYGLPVVPPAHHFTQSSPDVSRCLLDQSQYDNTPGTVV